MKASSARKYAYLAAFIAAGLAVASWLTVLTLRWVDPPTTMFMLLDSSGVRPVSYDWTDWPEISRSAALAVLASEDQKFPTHFGLDLGSIRDSIDAGTEGGAVRGASTITQQVAKNLFLWPGRSFIRKGIEAYMTLVIEVFWTKRRILEVYLNIAEFGPGIYGVGAASPAFFGKPAAELTDAEAALLASVLPNPKIMRVDNPSEYVRERQAWVIEHIGRLRRDGALSSIE